jgi:hypothetical protein
VRPAPQPVERSLPCTQPHTNRSVALRVAPRRRASGAARPPASMANAADRSILPRSVASCRCQDSLLRRIASRRAGASNIAPRAIATKRNQLSKRGRSRCQPCPSGSRKKSVTSGMLEPQNARLPWHGVWSSATNPSSKPISASNRRAAGGKASPIRGSELIPRSIITTRRVGAKFSAAADPAGPEPRIRISASIDRLSA